jgi:GTP-binding protein
LPSARIERRDFIRLFSEAQFLAAAGRASELPAPGPPEIVFAGRSNVGKSSAINAIVGRKRLAFTSKTPGRTQTINFYSLGDAARLVDLPGYGYARVPRPQRAQWRELVAAYLDSRPGLAGIVVVMDARHPLTPLDAQLLEWLGARRTLIVLAKADKLTRTEQASLKARFAGALLFSSVTGQGVEECRGLLETWLEQAAEIKSPR